ncbi:UNVERIFIED_CONTAM: putative germin-like protein 2-1 [Sesamum angustifolium]|uniref:Germin-like protein n=1 Tax=Sesamum angustifolium TaxID=2727405 RepID=A0AAW2PVC2_9LAMI
MAKHIILLSLVALSFCLLAFAFEPSPLQDFCVADSTSSGHPSVCSPAARAQHSWNLNGSYRLCTVGNQPPHTHPRATEILTVLEVKSGSSPQIPTIAHHKDPSEGRLCSQWVFQRNVGTGNAVAIAALSSQNPGVITIANAVFETWYQQ